VRCFRGLLCFFGCFGCFFGFFSFFINFSDPEKTGVGEDVWAYDDRTDSYSSGDILGVGGGILAPSTGGFPHFWEVVSLDPQLTRLQQGSGQDSAYDVSRVRWVGGYLSGILFSSVSSECGEPSTVGSRGKGKVHGDGLDDSGGSGGGRGSGAAACLPWLVLFLFKDMQSTLQSGVWRWRYSLGRDHHHGAVHTNLEKFQLINALW